MANEEGVSEDFIRSFFMLDDDCQPCLCGRETTQEIDINNGVKVWLCPLCAFMIYKVFSETIKNEGSGD